MNNQLSGTAQTIVLLACSFIFFLNLGLIFAYLRRGRDQAELRRKKPRPRMPWESTLDGPSAELARRVAELRRQAPTADQPDTPEDRPH